MSEEKLKLEDLLSDVKNEANSEKIEYVAIVGCGMMGQGIAWSISAAGIDVMILEKDEKYLEKAKQNIEAAMDREIARWAMTISEKKSILGKIKWSVDFEDLRECDLIIEAVEENFQLKRLIFKKCDEIARPDTIFISNTSTLSLSKIAEITDRRDKIIGMHFLHPVNKIPLVELIRASETSDKTVETIKSFATKIGKTAVEVFEYPGFITTRTIVPLLNEAMHIYLEGLASAEDIDTAMKLGYNFQMGPLEMADSMGLDEVLAWMETLWATLGEPRYRPCPILRKLVREKKLGKKTGEGFYKYDENEKIV